MTDPERITLHRIFRDGRVRYEGGCWIWTRGTTDGYGAIYNPGGSKRVHRAVYEALVGPVPKGMELDHLCRERLCCNPLHLEVVTRRTNILDGTSPQAINARKTVCPKGHPLEKRNDKWRFCRTCHKKTLQESYLRRKAARAARS